MDKRTRWRAQPRRKRKPKRREAKGLGPSKITRHHSVPKHYCRKLEVNPNFNGNVIPKRRDEHEAWHLLFLTLPPWEVEELLLSGKFSLGTKKRERAYRLIFGSSSFRVAARIVRKEWVGLYDLRRMAKKFQRIERERLRRAGKKYA